jgi:hypothetical protein
MASAIISSKFLLSIITLNYTFLREHRNLGESVCYKNKASQLGLDTAAYRPQLSPGRCSKVISGIFAHLQNFTLQDPYLVQVPYKNIEWRLFFLEITFNASGVRKVRLVQFDIKRNPQFDFLCHRYAISEMRSTNFLPTVKAFIRSACGTYSVIIWSN